MSRPRQGYEGVALAAPYSTAYQRYSIESAHWWIARALGGSLDLAGVAPRDLDGFSVASFTLHPDTAVGLVQHLGLSPRWLDHIPMGGASGIVALRRAARAVQAGDAEIVACVRGRRHKPYRQLPPHALHCSETSRASPSMRPIPTAMAART